VHARGIDAGVVEQVGDAARGEVERRGRVLVDVDAQLALGQQTVGEVGDGQPDAVVAEVDADERARRRVEGQQDRRPPALAGALAVRRGLGDEAVALHRADDRADGRARQPGLAGDVGTADGAAAAQHVDDLLAIALAQQRQRPSGAASLHRAATVPESGSNVKRQP